MIRFALLFSILAAPVAAQSALIDPIGERPGRWISIPREDAPAQIMEAPASGPLITTARAPEVVLVVPEAAPLIEPPRAVPDTRPIQRPNTVVAVSDAVPGAEIAAAIAAVLAEAEAAAVVEAAVEVAVEAMPAAIEAAVEPVVEAAPVPVEIVTEVAPLDAEEDVAVAEVVEVIVAAPVAALPTDAAAMAEALAVLIAVEARQIVTGGRREIPQTSPDIGELLPTGVSEAVFAPSGTIGQAQPLANAGAEVLALAALENVAEAVAEETVSAAAELRAPNPPTPVFTVSLAMAPPQAVPAPISTVVWPVVTRPETNAVPPQASVTPTQERAPILPRLHPTGPAAAEGISSPLAMQTVRPFDVVLPRTARAPGPVARLILAAAPRFDPFPVSALPPSALPNGPDSQTNITAPPAPIASANAAAVFTGPDMAPTRVLPLEIPMHPLDDVAPLDPDTSPAMPEPDTGAIARMMEDALICWRLADLSAEAQWAIVSVDVALDGWNMPSAESITLTGYARVGSDAAQDAYAAAQSALMGCAMASDRAPATAVTSLLFDRYGVHLR